jgi:hypothetical protein
MPPICSLVGPEIDGDKKYLFSGELKKLFP